MPPELHHLFLVVQPLGITLNVRSRGQNWDTGSFHRKSSAIVSIPCTRAERLHRMMRSLMR